MSRTRIKIPFPMFSNLDMRVIIFDDEASYIAFREKAWDQHKNGYASASTWGRREKDVFLVEIIINRYGIWKGLMVECLVHEAVHATWFMSEHYGVHDDEFNAYATSFIVQTLLDKIPVFRGE